MYEGVFGGASTPNDPNVNVKADDTNISVAVYRVMREARSVLATCLASMSTIMWI